MRWNIVIKEVYFIISFPYHTLDNFPQAENFFLLTSDSTAKWERDLSLYIAISKH